MELTKRIILAMSVGSVLDALVAHNIFGWEYVQNAPDGFYCLSVGNDKGWWKSPDWKGWACAACEGLPYQYSDDIEKAWSVVQQVQKLYPYWRFSLLGGDRDFRHGFEAEWFGEGNPHNDYGERHGTAYCTTAPEAICKSALIACLGLEENIMKP